MTSTLDLLRGLPLCEGLDEKELQRLARHANLVELPVGSTVYRTGEPIERVYLMVSGRARLTVAVPGKAAPLEVDSGEGGVLGAVALLESGNSLGDMVIREPARLLSFEQEEFLELLLSIPRLALHMLRRLAKGTVQLAGMMSRQSTARATGVVWSGPRGRGLLELLARELEARGERVARVTLEGSRQAEPWEQLLRGHDRVLLELELDKLSGSWMERAAQCDDLVWLVDGESEPGQRGILASLLEKAPQAAQRSHVVWMLPEGQQVAPPWDRAWDLNERRHLMVEIAASPQAMTRLGRMGLDRLVRRLRGVMLGISLAGGGARGLAHLGVFRALERAGIGFDVMSGTSCGAMVGITYAAGYSPDFLISSYQRDLRPTWLFRHLPKGHNWYLIWQFRTGAWNGMLRRYLHDWTLERLPIPFHAVTVDLISGREVVHRSGPAVRAILESINLPIIAKPIVHDGMALVDGAVLNNLPADVLADQGAQLVVGVDVSSQLRDEFAGNRPGMATAQMKSAGPLETIIRVVETQGRGLGTLRAEAMDLTIRPDASAFSFVDFTRAPELADVGEAAAEAAIPRLRQLMAEAESRAVARRSVAVVRS